ncbi:unnamed protein product [Fraxinus pennsylvanica]|uniref:Response regulatory domain-containing protein n=1 Tax=Fraxinus pennsylvanica TaxID=56036 RepID=A0AAD1Z7U6_9LAMI|nr:unnamed protein product [Fraxinus pennsylvanica]
MVMSGDIGALYKLVTSYVAELLICLTFPLVMGTGSVTAVESERRALQYLGLDAEKSSVGFDGLKVNLIMIDYSMPEMTGYELLKKIKSSSNLREIPVMIMSSENVLAHIDRIAPNLMSSDVGKVASMFLPDGTKNIPTKAKKNVIRILTKAQVDAELEQMKTMNAQEAAAAQAVSEAV